MGVRGTRPQGRSWTRGGLLAHVDFRGGGIRDAG